MKTVLATFELLVGLASGYETFIMFVSLASMSTPIWGAEFILYWGALCAGPLLLVIGASLTLAGAAQKPAAVLIILGSATLTCWAIPLGTSLPKELARGTLTPVSPGLVEVVAGILLIVLASDFAAYKIYRLVRTKET